MMSRDDLSGTAQLEVSAVESPWWVIADVSGEADANTVDQLRDALMAQIFPLLSRAYVEARQLSDGRRVARPWRGRSRAGAFYGACERKKRAGQRA